MGPAGDEVELAIASLAVGGDGVARQPDGRVVFVPGVVPGDLVDVRLVERRKRFARAELVEVLRPSPLRVAPPCPQVERGCGGCSWQHVALAAQRDAKRALVRDAVERIGHLPPSGFEVVDGPSLAADGFRTTLRGAVLDGHVGLRYARSHDALAVDACLVAHPLLAELLAEGRFPHAQEVTLRCGARTGDRIVVATPSAAGARVPPDVVVAERARPGAPARLVGGSARADLACHHEEAGGRRWRISADSFFQTRADGADALVDAVRRAAQPPGEWPRPAGRARRALDACSGVGLLAAALPDADLVAVEVARSAVADARVNLAGRRARVVRAALESWPPEPFDVVVADPARRGLGSGGVAVLAATGAAVIVLVSCDAGSLGRDAGALGAAGYRLERCELVDLFPHTAHVEVVSRFVRRAA